MTTKALPQTRLMATNTTAQTKSIATTKILISQSKDIIEATSEKTYIPVTETSTTQSSPTTKTKKEPYTTTKSLVARLKAEILMSLNEYSTVHYKKKLLSQVVLMTIKSDGVNVIQKTHLVKDKHQGLMRNLISR